MSAMNTWYDNLEADEKKILRTITHKDALRGVYLDFEGFTDKPPSLAGVYVAGEFSQYFFDERLTIATNHYISEYLPFSDFVQLLINYIEDEERYIIGYTLHEANMLPDLGSPVEWYKDAHKYFKREFHWNDGWRPSEWDLDSLCTIFNYPRTNYGERQATQRLRSFLTQAESKAEYESITGTVKAKFTKLLNYNREDVMGLRHCLLTALSM